MAAARHLERANRLPSNRLPFSSRDLYLHVILHLGSEFRINRPIWCGDIAKKRFSIWRTSASWICKISILC